MTDPQSDTFDVGGLEGGLGGLRCQLHLCSCYKTILHVFPVKVFQNAQRSASLWSAGGSQPHQLGGVGGCWGDVEAGMGGG